MDFGKNPKKVHRDSKNGGPGLLDGKRKSQKGGNGQNEKCPFLGSGEGLSGNFVENRRLDIDIRSDKNEDLFGSVSHQIEVRSGEE
jgi:hypothetical protein